MAIQITSSAFSEGERSPRSIPAAARMYRRRWRGREPQGAKSLAIIMDDPDAPGRTFVHWVLFNIPPGTVELAEGRGALAWQARMISAGRATTALARRGQTHRYFLKLYALDQELKLTQAPTKADVENAMKGHILASGQWMGKFSR